MGGRLPQPQFGVWHALRPFRKRRIAIAPRTPPGHFEGHSFQVGSGGMDGDLCILEGILWLTTYQNGPFGGGFGSTCRRCAHFTTN